MAQSVPIPAAEPTVPALPEPTASGAAQPALPKVIFLDVDGVLVTSRGLAGEDSTRRTGARLVLSSTWRDEAQCPGYLGALRAALAHAGVGGALLGCTPTAGHASRGAEILAWLRDNPHHRRFAILEDSPRHVASFAALPALRARYVQTDAREGLTEELAEAVANILA